MSPASRVSTAETAELLRPPLKSGRPRVCVVSENMGMALDEGGRKFSRSLVDALSSKVPVLGVSVGCEIDSPNTVGVTADKLFAGRELRHTVRAFRPDLLCYVPSASDTVFSLLRLRVLAASCRGVTTALVALQPRAHGAAGRWLQSRLAPDIVFVQSNKAIDRLSHVGRPVRWLPSGVDLDRFKPAGPAMKAALRAKYGLPQDTYLVLHVGHITGERNLGPLESIQRRSQVVMVTGNSVGEDPEARRKLDDAGVIVLDQYLESIEEVYQAADCFVFPVHSPLGSIEIPLSVLEAMACNLPVVSTRFGGLEDLLSPGVDSRESGLAFAGDASELSDLVSQAQNQGEHAQTREMVEPFSWDGVASRILDEAGQIPSTSRGER